LTGLINNDDPTVYRQGTSIEVVRMPIGTVGFLICGDLFDDALVARFRALRIGDPDIEEYPSFPAPRRSRL